MKRLFSLLCPLLLLFSGCSGNSGSATVQNPTYTVGIVLKAMSSQHWMDMRSGINDAARALNIDIVLLYPQAEEDIQEQQQMFRDLMMQQLDAVILAPCDSGNCAPLAELAKQKNIPMVILDTPATDVTLPYIGADNRRIGLIAATQMAELMTKTGEIAVISGVESQSSHTERVEGFFNTLSSYPNIKFVGQYRGDSDFARGMQSMKRILEEHPSVRGVFCTSAVMALGAIEQIRAGGYENPPAIVAVDTQDDALQALQDGTLQGLVTQDGYEAGYRAVQYVVDLLDNKTLSDTQYIESTLLTKDTVGKFSKKNNSQRGANP